MFLDLNGFHLTKGSFYLHNHRHPLVLNLIGGWSCTRGITCGIRCVCLMTGARGVSVSVSAIGRSSPNNKASSKPSSRSTGVAKACWRLQTGQCWRSEQVDLKIVGAPAPSLRTYHLHPNNHHSSSLLPPPP